MTNKELQDILSKYPDECIVMYLHNKHSRIDIDTVEYKEDTLLSGQQIQSIVLEAKFEED